MLYDYEQIKNLQIVDSKPLNFGLFDKNGITVEVLVFGKNEQMRLQSLLKGITKDDSVLILSGWSWYVNNSKFITGYMIQHKINVTRDTEIRFMKTEILMDSSILHFNFDHSLERLIYGRCFGIIETCWLMVARAPTYFYGSYYGVLVTDGTYFGIIAVTVHDNGDLKTEYKFNQDSIFKLKQVNAKLFDVAHRKLTDSVLQHFGLNDIQKPSVFYVDESTNIINDDTAEVEFGENDESDIVYPEKGKNVSATTLSELFKSLKLK
uniref:Uncharacterized protein n=1 Tax=Panagrolaimus superbus TaxID=310955 RepID=A0A914XZY9_9BILA